jgi:hypothetical protein
MITLETIEVTPTRTQKRSIERSKGPTSAESMQSKAMMETTADGNKKIIWYEISTNISKETDQILVNYEEVSNAVKFTILGIGQKFFDIDKDFIDRFARMQDENKIFSNIGTSVNDGSFYGTGTAAISNSTDNYLIHILNQKTDEYETIVRKTCEVESTSTFIDSNTTNEWKKLGVKVAQTFSCKTNMRYTHSDLIDEFKKVISITEAIRIHSKKLIVKFNDEEIKPTLTVWDTSDTNGIPIPQFNYIKDNKGGDIKVVSITHRNFHNKEQQIDFEITAVGKRKSGEKSILDILDINNEDSGDRPYLVVRLKDTNKVIGIIFLRNRGGDINLNRVVVEAVVDRKDIIGFFARMTKGENFVVGFESAVGKEFRKQLEKACYPAEETKEECKQNHLFNIIKNDSYGPDIDKDGADNHRKKLGIGFLNKLTSEQRKNYVTKEHKEGPNRYDIYIRVPKGESVVISGFTRTFDEEVCVVLENKKGNFKEPHIDQSSTYAASSKGCVMVHGIGLEVSDDMKAKYAERFTQMQSSNQFRLEHIGGEMFDLNKDYFQYKKYEEYWRDFVNNKESLVVNVDTENE